MFVKKNCPWFCQYMRIEETYRHAGVLQDVPVSFFRIRQKTDSLPKDAVYMYNWHLLPLYVQQITVRKFVGPSLS